MVASAMQHLLHEPTPKKKIIHAENVKLWAHMLIALERGRSALNLITQYVESQYAGNAGSGNASWLLFGQIQAYD